MANANNTSLPGETWKPIPGWEGYYQASDHGRVRSLDRTITYPSGKEVRLKGKILSPGKREQGHLYVILNNHGFRKTMMVHRLVLEAFVGPMPKGIVCCHNDGNPANNHLDNLRYDTVQGNILDKFKHGTDHYSTRETCIRGHKLVEPNIVDARIGSGDRACKACNRARVWVHRYPHLKKDIQKVSDEYYEQVLEGVTKEVPQERCDRGHLLDGANLMPSQAKRGRRVCLACNRAHGPVRRNPALKPDIQQIADSYYEKIMGKVATSE